MEAKSAPTLTPVLTYYADVSGLDEVGRGPFGHRVIGNVTGGKFTGDLLEGTIVGAGADWLLLGDDGVGRIDVRLTCRTDDGAHIYVQYYGLIEITAAVRAILTGQTGKTEFSEQYFFTVPRLETGDSRYAWLNHTVFIGQGRLVTGPRVEYRVFKVDNRS
jgi:Protein of unknown function (DUF3237)